MTVKSKNYYRTVSSHRITKRDLYYMLDTNMVLDFIGGKLLKEVLQDNVAKYGKTPKYFKEIAVFIVFRNYMGVKYQNNYFKNHGINLRIGISSTIYNETQRVIRDKKHPFIRRFIREFSINGVSESELRQNFLSLFHEKFKGSLYRLNVSFNHEEQNYLYSILNRIQRDLKSTIGRIDKKILIEASSLVKYNPLDTVTIFSADRHFKFYHLTLNLMSQMYEHYDKIKVVNHRYYPPVKRCSCDMMNRNDYILLHYLRC